MQCVTPPESWIVNINTSRGVRYGSSASCQINS